MTIQSRWLLYYGKIFPIPYLVHKVYSQRSHYSYTIIQLQILKLKIIRRNRAVKGQWLSEFISVTCLWWGGLFKNFPKTHFKGFPFSISKLLDNIWGENNSLLLYDVKAKYTKANKIMVSGSSECQLCAQMSQLKHETLPCFIAVLSWRSYVHLYSDISSLMT